MALGVLLTAAAAAASIEEANVVKSNLQGAVDAAVLASAKTADTSAKDNMARTIFWSNFARNGESGGAGPVGSQATIESLSIDGKNVSLTASATVNLLPFTGSFAVTVRASATAVASTAGIELAIVIDNTASLLQSGMEAARAGATDLINDVLPDGQTIQSWISIVPFGAEVNFGPQHTDWLTGYNSSAYAPGSWSGCMMARAANGHDQDDATPSEAPFTAFLYPSTYPKYALYGWQYANGGSSLTFVNTSTTKLKPGDNSWATGSANNITEGYAYAEVSDMSNPPSPAGWNATGPNLGCPYQPIVAETSDRDTLLDAVAAMRMVWRGGTTINAGLQAGWLTISSKWQGLWGDDTLPRTSGTQKIIVLMTDGTNSWDTSSTLYPDANGDGDVTAYGRLSQSLTGATTASGAEEKLNTITSQVCTNIKQEGITIYVLLYNHSSIDTTTQNLMEACATSSSTFFISPDANSLEETFAKIGENVAGVSLVQ
ncbi:vWA domain-containing protein [Acetobacter conturbans]|uniref:vWA domain-containing protein n=1 Tax=Acetobacter conturbans TaxID=1737472 RepID=UPI001569A078